MHAHANLPPLKITHIGTAEGLSQGSVYAILKDSRGVMWFGTQDGLNSMQDGKISIYRPDDAQSHTLAGLKITGIIEDANGYIWIGSESGLSKYDYLTGKFHNYFKGEEVIPIKFLEGEIWLWSAKKGFLRLHTNTLKYRQFFRKLNFVPDFSTYFSSVSIISPEEFWLSYDQGLIHYKNGLEEHFFSNFKDNKAGEAVHINYIKWHKNYLYVACDDGLRILNPSTKTVEKISSFKGQKIELLQSIAIDKQDRLWLATEFKGILVYDIKTGQIEQIQRKTEFGIGLNDNLISHLYIDNNNTIWANADPYGIDKIELLKGNFQKYNLPFPADFPVELRNNSVRTVCEFENDLWVGTLNSGLWQLDKSDFSVKRYFTTANSSLPSNHISHLISTPDRTLMIGTAEGLATVKNQQLRYVKDPQGVEHLIRSLEYHQGKVYLSTESGIKIYDVAKNKILPERVWNNKRVIFTKHLSGHELFIASYADGLYMLKGFEKKLVIPDILPLFIRQDKRNNFYVGSSKGLFYIHKNGNILKKYTTRDGLPNDFVYCGEMDQNEHLWLSTNKGMAQLNTTNGKITTFNLNDGLQDYEYNSFASTVLTDGRLLFGGVNGFNYFYPADIELVQSIRFNRLHNNLDVLIPSKIEAFLSKPGTFTTPALEDKSFTSLFRKIDMPMPNFLYTDGEAWVRFKLRNNSIKHWFLEIENTRLSEIELWVMEKNQVAYYAKSGDHLPFSLYRLKDPNPIFELNLTENEQFEVYIKASTTRDLKIPIRIWNESSLTEHISNRKFIWGVFSGFILLISFYNLLLFFTIKDKTYLFYTIYILSFGLFQFSIYGLSFQYFWSNSPVNEYAFLEFLYVSYIFVTLFTEYFLDLNHHLKNWKYIRNGIVILNIALFIITPFWHPNQVNYFAIGMSFIFTSIFYYVCVSYFKKGIALIYYYAFAVFFLTTASVIIALQNLGIISPIHQEYVLMSGSMMEIILFSLALGYKFRSNQLEKERQQQMRNEISENLHDDLAASLSSLSMYAELSKRKTNDPAEVTNRLDGIATKARGILDKVRTAVYEINPTNDAEEDWLDRIVSFGKEIFEHNHVDFQTDISADFRPEKVPQGMRRDLFYLFKEAMNNTAKYASATEVWLIMDKTNGKKVMELKDNGKGFDIDAADKGNGLQNMQTRASKMGATLSIISKPGNGTIIRITY